MRYLTLLLMCSLALGSAWAENSTRVGDYTIHHNALTTDNLSPKIANHYQIQRSNSRGMVNISIIQRQPNTPDKPVAAKVSLNSRNLIGQRRDIPLREIREGQAIYYIADFPVGHRDRLTFAIEAIPEGSRSTLNAQFEQEFFTR